MPLKPGVAVGRSSGPIGVAAKPQVRDPADEVRRRDHPNHVAELPKAHRESQQRLDLAP
jgi:hypothetical protein